MEPARNTAVPEARKMPAETEGAKGLRARATVRNDATVTIYAESQNSATLPVLFCDPASREPDPPWTQAMY
ncbi:hypothetical protein GCM10007108_03210 [Thermogymnomonas acidicola]|uniref:Uncharacterized protein n=1 Tax=Thermogymnomonas acidicola TaxID=399579 RepID=A0AA37BQ67_9ARCH|nr:hypothetical protein GCM10007108_03210 [Thermogymnomonas acidicola]